MCLTYTDTHIPDSALATGGKDTVGVIVHKHVALLRIREYLSTTQREGWSEEGREGEREGEREGGKKGGREGGGKGGREEGRKGGRVG